MAAGAAGTPPLEPEAVRGACFYSITATQPGLKGVELGHQMIKRAADLVRLEFPSLSTTCTLSPLPQFAQWLHARLGAEAEAGAIEGGAGAVTWAAGAHGGSGGPAQHLAASSADAVNRAGGVIGAETGADAGAGCTVSVAAPDTRLPQPSLLTPCQARVITAAAAVLLPAPDAPTNVAQTHPAAALHPSALLAALLASGAWVAGVGEVQGLEEAVRGVVMKAAARYLLLERRQGMQG